MSISDYKFRVRVEDAPDYYYRGIQTDVVDPTVKDPANPGNVHRDFMVERITDTDPTAEATGLDITSNVGTVIVDDITSITADPNDIKYCLVSVVRDNASSLLEIQVQEKVLGNYAETPEDKTWECDIAEFSVIAAGSTLVKL